MRFKNMVAPLTGSPVCPCFVCARRRATQLAQALQNKFGSLTAIESIQ
jgi:hypothetical protein